MEINIDLNLIGLIDIDVTKREEGKPITFNRMDPKNGNRSINLETIKEKKNAKLKYFKV